MLLFIIGSYLLGAVPFGFLAGRAKGIDLRQHGSCNIGATNALRVLGKPIGSIVFICDFFKGYLPVFLWMMYGRHSSPWVEYGGMALVSLAAILGHVYTCFLGFRGGKGVATGAGVLFAISPVIGIVSLASWLVSVAICRYVSLSSMIASLVMVCAGLYEFRFFTEGDWSWRPQWLVILFLILVALLVIVKHRSNIARLRKGSEPKIFSGKKS